MLSIFFWLWARLAVLQTAFFFIFFSFTICQFSLFLNFRYFHELSFQLNGLLFPFSNWIFILIYFGKAWRPQIFCEISTVDLSYVVTVKSTTEILQNFVVFSEHINFRFSYWIIIFLIHHFSILVIFIYFSVQFSDGLLFSFSNWI